MDPRKDDSAPAGSSAASSTVYRAAHGDSGRARDSAAAADPPAAATATTPMIYRIPTETTCLRQDVVFRVGACYALLRMRTLSISYAEGFHVISSRKVEYDKSS
jgi:hypothetical protein